MTSSRVDIAVIGGGAKAAALTAKACALRRASIADIHVTVFEQSAIGAHWSGKGGYTDGKQRLCTPAERDIGFPYTSMFGAAIDRELYAQFSWASYLLSKPSDYSAWVDSGRRAPMHQDFAAYLAWVVEHSEATVVKARIEGLRPVAGRAGPQWQVQHRATSHRLASASDTRFDGVVVSSPGPARRVPIAFPARPSHPTGKGPTLGSTLNVGKVDNIFDGTDFWLRLKTVHKVLRAPGPSDQIAIIGAGGTAAAVLAWLTRSGYKDREIVMVADQAALFTRGDSVFENRLFSDEGAWQALSDKSKRDFSNRLNRGVVWGTVMDEVASASRLVFVDGRAARIRIEANGELDVAVHRDDGYALQLRPSMVVDASGFEPWWFLDLISKLPARDRGDATFRQRLQSKMGVGLNFEGPEWPFPRLHAPFVSSAIGPGFGSLMALGGMSDRVLRTYLP